MKHFIRSFLLFSLSLVVLGVSFHDSASEAAVEAVSGECADLKGTLVHSNANLGSFYFDGEKGGANLSIVGASELGVAPADAGKAACLGAGTGGADYDVEGYVWSSNLGFISFACKNGLNRGMPCGNYEYGVKVSEDTNGLRTLSGHAWNETFGYMQFGGSGGTSGVKTLVFPDIGTQSVVVGGDTYTLSYTSNVIAQPLEPNFASIIEVQKSGVVVAKQGVKFNQPKTFGDVNVTVTAIDFPEPTAAGVYVPKPAGYLDGQQIVTYNSIYWGGIKLPPLTLTITKTNPVSFEYGAKLVDPENDDVWEFSTDSWVWSEAGVWLNMYGASVSLAELPVEPKEVWDKSTCKDTPFACIELIPELDTGSDDPSGFNLKTTNPLAWDLTWGFKIDERVAIADGKDGYQIHLYLHDSGGEPLSDYALTGLESMTFTFSWEDTVKLNQLAGQKALSTLSKTESPAVMGNGGVGGVVYKPIELSFSDFEPVSGDAGHYRLKVQDYQGKIRSIAPTSNANLSKMASLKDKLSFLVQNGVFIWELAKDGSVWTDDIEPNRLILKHITVSHDLPEASMNQFCNGPCGKNPFANPVFANNTPNISLKFRPAVELNTLYAGNNEDYIRAFRNIPMNFKLGAQVLGTPLTIAAPQFNLFLAYATQLTESECGQGVVANFDFHFDGDYSGTTQTFDLDDFYQTSGLTPSPKFIDLQAVAELPVPTEGVAPKLCNEAQGPTLYSEIAYEVQVPKSVQYSDTVPVLPFTVGQPSEQKSPSVVKPSSPIPSLTLDMVTRSVAYYGNMLPKIDGSSIKNQPIFVSGTVYTSTAFSPSSEVDAVQTSGNINVNVVRDTVYENLKKYVGNQTTSSTRECTITSIGDTLSISGCAANKDYHIFSVGKGEKIFYTKNDVSLAVADGTYQGKWIIVADSGNIYLKDNIYNPAVNTNNHISLVALRGSGEKYNKSGHAYLHPSVKNFQGTLILDGSFRSYFGEVPFKVNQDGAPEGSLTSMLEVLDTQFYCQCNIFARNTIGGADLDKAVKGNPDKAKPYLLLGSGETIEAPLTTAQRYRAIMDDLNYLRLFVLEVEIDEETGLPVDQACGKALNSEDIKKIANGEEVIGEDGKACDGINPFALDTEGGDLVSTGVEAKRAAGLDASYNLPVYIIYSSIPKDSVIFSKPGAIK